MVKYTVEAITAILAPIQTVPQRPTFRGLWHLVQHLSECLGKISHPKHPNEGFAGYMMTSAAFALYSTTPWAEPKDVGEYFEIPVLAITETEQKTEERKWKAEKDLRDNFETVRTALRLLFERIIAQAYHSGGTGTGGLARRGFGNDEPPDILARLQRLYGNPSLQELDQALMRLNDPMDRNQPVEVMLRAMEEIQIFLMAHPEGDREMSEVNLISYGTIKLSKCGGLYTKAMERWQAKEQDDKKLWANFRTHYITEYEKLLAEGSGTTLAQDGYGGAFHATETTADETSLTESIVRYAERTTAAESKVSELENRLAQLEMDNQAPPTGLGGGYYAPEAAYFTNDQKTTQVPPTIHMPPPQQYGGQHTYPRTTANKRARRQGGSVTQEQGQQWGRNPNTYQPPQQQQNPYQHQYGEQAGRGGRYGGGGRSRRGRGGRGGRGRGENKTHRNVLKRFENLNYCYTCGYDVDHAGHQCTHTNGGFHMPNIKRDEAHLYAHQGACMVAQHKSLANGEGCGMGWIMANSISKAQFVMERQQLFRQQNGYHGGQQQNWQGPNNNQQQNWGQSNWQQNRY